MLNCKKSWPNTAWSSGKKNPFSIEVCVHNNWARCAAAAAILKTRLNWVHTDKTPGTKFYPVSFITNWTHTNGKSYMFPARAVPAQNLNSVPLDIFFRASFQNEERQTPQGENHCSSPSLKRGNISEWQKWLIIFRFSGLCSWRKNVLWKWMDFVFTRKDTSKAVWANLRKSFRLKSENIRSNLSPVGFSGHRQIGYFQIYSNENKFKVFKLWKVMLSRKSTH